MHGEKVRPRGVILVLGTVQGSAHLCAPPSSDVTSTARAVLGRGPDPSPRPKLLPAESGGRVPHQAQGKTDQGILQRERFAHADPRPYSPTSHSGPSARGHYPKWGGLISRGRFLDAKPFVPGAKIRVDGGRRFH